MRDDVMHITCDHATGLVPAYLDGELSEAQAAPLREHLLACHGCREIAKEGKTLKRWFVADDAPAVPVGFASRVARRAFAGDLGEVAAPALVEQEPEGKLLPFILRLTAAAAAVLLILAAALQFQSRPTPADELRADDLDEVWAEIYGLENAPPAPAALDAALDAVPNAQGEEGPRAGDRDVPVR